MGTASEAAGRLIAWMRWTARVLGLPWSGVFLADLILAGPVVREPVELEGLFIVGFALVALASALLAWRRERTGRIALVVCAVTSAIFVHLASGRNKLLVASLLPSPFLVSGALFLAARWRTRVVGAS